MGEEQRRIGEGLENFVCSLESMYVTGR
jgi:hypothetical protein